MSWSNFCFLIYLALRGVRTNAVMTDCSKRCGRLRKVTSTVSIVFFGRTWLLI